MKHPGFDKVFHTATVYAGTLFNRVSVYQILGKNAFFRLST